MLFSGCCSVPSASNGLNGVTPAADASAPAANAARRAAISVSNCVATSRAAGLAVPSAASEAVMRSAAEGRCSSGSELGSIGVSGGRSGLIGRRVISGSDFETMASFSASTGGDVAACDDAPFGARLGDGDSATRFPAASMVPYRRDETRRLRRVNVSSKACSAVSAGPVP